MDRNPEQDTTRPQELAGEESVEATAAPSWKDVGRRVARTAPRLREVAMQALLLAPLLGPLADDFWGGGGSRGGC